MKKHQGQIGITEFRAHCLELIRDVHRGKTSAVTITSRGKPVAKLVPIENDRQPFYGCLKGLAEIRGDLTEPTGG